MQATTLVIILVGISQGIVGLADLSLSYLFKDDLKLQPAQVAIISSIASLPWIFKPIWGFLSDCYPIWGYRRKSYLSIFGFLGFLCWTWMSHVQTIRQTVLTMLMIQISSAFCNVIGEALVVQQSQLSEEETASQNVSLFFGVRNVGIILVAYFGGLLLEYISKQSVFQLTSAFPLLVCLAAFILPERNTSKKNTGLQIQNIWTFVNQPSIYGPIIFILLFMITPSAGDAMFYFYTNQLSFGPEYLGRLKMALGIANLIGIGLYMTYFKNIEFKKMMAWSTVVCAIVSASQILLVTRYNLVLGIPDGAFCMFSSFLVQAIAEVNTIPVLVFCCKMCPKNIEGTMYALLMSTINFGSLISYQLGALLMWMLGITASNFTNLWILLAISSGSMVLPLPLLSLIKT